MKQFLRVVLFGTLFSTSCSTSNQTQQTYFESIESTHPIDKTFTTIPVKTEFGVPYQIKVVDSLALIADVLDNKTLLTYDLKHNLEIGRFISIGRGPGEVLSPIAIEYQNDSLYILDRQTLSGRFLVCSFSDLFQLSIENYKSYYFPRARTITKTETGFLTSGPFPENMIREYDAKYDSIPVSCNFYPEFIVQQIGKAFDRYLIGQGDAVYQNGNLLVTYAFLGDIKFYRKGKQGYEATMNYSIGNSQPLKDRIAQNNLKIQPEDIMYFNSNSSCVSDDAFYVLFDGQHMTREPRKTHCFLMKFDLNGSFIESYRLNAPVACYTVTPDNQMYAITITPEDEYILSHVQL